MYAAKPFHRVVLPHIGIIADNAHSDTDTVQPFHQIDRGGQTNAILIEQDQIDVARRKAGIPRGAELLLERFRTTEVGEEAE